MKICYISPQIMLCRRILTFLFASFACFAAAPDGAALYKTRCAICHDGKPQAHMPTRDELVARTPEAIVKAMFEGPMQRNGRPEPGRRSRHREIHHRQGIFNHRRRAHGRTMRRRAQPHDHPAHGLERMGTGPRQFALSAEPSPRRSRRAQAQIEMGLRISRRHLRARPTRRRWRTSLRRQRQRHSLFPQRFHWLHLFDLLEPAPPSATPSPSEKWAAVS